jgi:hypothetical protein
VFQACYANPHDHHPMHFRVSLFIHIFTRCWQHARGLRLESAFIYPGVGNTLGGCVSNRHSFIPALATCSGAVPYSPMLATLGGYAYMLTLAFALFVPGVSNTLRGCALCRLPQQSSMLQTALRLPRRLRLNAASAPFGSTLMTLCRVDSCSRYSTPVSHTPATSTSSPTIIKD